ncbi:MAG TPA: hypothetical protein VF245_12925 [Solirubrobacterales bacterium]
MSTARCDNCGKVSKIEDLAEPSRLSERLDPGGSLPAGECPACGALAYAETYGQRTIRETAEAIGYSDGNDDDETGGVDALIDYKNAVEERLTLALDTLASIATGVPREDEWRSAADFMEATARTLDLADVPRPEHYPED